MVEGLVESFLGQGPVGNAHLRIHPGVEALVAASQVPLEVRNPKMKSELCLKAVKQTKVEMKVLTVMIHMMKLNLLLKRNELKKKL